MFSEIGHFTTVKINLEYMPPNRSLKLTLMTNGQGNSGVTMQ